MEVGVVNLWVWLIISVCIIYIYQDAQVITDLRRVLRLEPNDPMPASSYEIARYMYMINYY